MGGVNGNICPNIFRWHKYNPKLMEVNILYEQHTNIFAARFLARGLFCAIIIAIARIPEYLSNILTHNGLLLYNVIQFCNGK